MRLYLISILFFVLAYLGVLLAIPQSNYLAELGDSMFNAIVVYGLYRALTDVREKIIARLLFILTLINVGVELFSANYEHLMWGSVATIVVSLLFILALKQR